MTEDRNAEMREAEKEIVALAKGRMTDEDARRVSAPGEKIGAIKREGRPLRLYAAPPDQNGLGTRWYSTPVVGRDTAAYVIAAPYDRMRELLRSFARRVRTGDSGEQDTSACIERTLADEAEQIIAQTSGMG